MKINKLIPILFLAGCTTYTEPAQVQEMRQDQKNRIIQVEGRVVNLLNLYESILRRTFDSLRKPLLDCDLLTAPNEKEAIEAGYSRDQEALEKTLAQLKDMQGIIVEELERTLKESILNGQ